MKRILAALGWLALFAAAGALAMDALALWLVPHHLPRHALRRLGQVGAVPAILAWLIGLNFAALPGARRPPQAPAHLGLAQGIWAMLGTLLMMLCGFLLPFITALYLTLIGILRLHKSPMPSPHDLPLMASGLLASELLAALWVLWYARRQGMARLRDGSASGLAWCAAPRRAYAAAALCALAGLLLAALEFHLIPPDMSKLKLLPMAQLYQGGPGMIALVLFVSIIMAPLLEETLFRGIAFAGIATRLGPLWASFITTAAFTALHAPEKIYYPIGFLDVALLALLACVLRLRYRSIRPGILMHFLYNFGMLLLPVLQ